MNDFSSNPYGPLVELAGVILLAVISVSVVLIAIDIKHRINRK